MAETMTLNLSEKEMAVLESLAAEKEMSKYRVKVYQIALEALDGVRSPQATETTKIGE